MAFPIPTFDELLMKGLALYKEYFSGEPKLAGIGPGRVNLIGEHTDYNDGFVFPMALPMVTIVLGSFNHLDECRLVTESKVDHLNNTTSFPIPSKEKLTPGFPSWANYVKGVVHWFPGDIMGFNAAIVSSVPVGAGLSSSAALEVATFTFLEALTNSHIDELEKALICQKAEHTFAKVPCGIMDQIISVKGLDHKILLVDCRTLEAELIDLSDDNIAFLIINTKVKHNLGGSDEYEARKNDCTKVAKLLNVKALRDVSMKEIDALYKKEIITEEVFRRARHVIKENARVYQAAHAIKKRDYEALGLLMYQSHYSLRFDYEVSCEQLDALVDIAMNVKGVYGARLTGAGFGGCTVNLVRKDLLKDIITEIKQKYTYTPPDFFIGHPSNGARIINLEKYKSTSECDLR